MSIIVGVDPGVHIGVVAAIDGRISELFTSSGHESLYRSLYRIFRKAQRIDHLVLETFSRGSGMTAPQLITVEIIGVVRLFTEQRGVPLVLQSPGVRKPYVVRARECVRVQFPRRVVTPHEIAATAHIFAFLDTHFHQEVLCVHP